MSITEHARRAMAAGGRNAQVNECYLCGRRMRGNAAHASHEKACYAKHGLEWLSAEDRRDLAERHPVTLAAHREREDAIRRGATNG